MSPASAPKAVTSMGEHFGAQAGIAEPAPAQRQRPADEDDQRGLLGVPAAVAGRTAPADRASMTMPLRPRSRQKARR